MEKSAGEILGTDSIVCRSGISCRLDRAYIVDGEATCHMMVKFANLLKSQPPAEAMRLAMIDAKEKYSSPSKWASFTVFGVSDR